MIANPLGGYLLDRSGRGSLIMGFGVVLQGVSIILASLLIRDVLYVSLMLSLAGFGGSLYWAASTTLGIDVGAPGLRAAASGTMFTLRNISLILGLALLPLFVAEASPAAHTGLLILNGHIDMVGAVRDYVLFAGLLSILAGALIVPYHLSSRPSKEVRAESSAPGQATSFRAKTPVRCSGPEGRPSGGA